MLCVAGCFAPGCSWGPQAPEPDKISLQGFELYYNRASMDKSEFEQFRLTGHTLYAECGLVVGGRHSVKGQKISDLDDDAINEIKKTAWDVRRYVDELHAQFKEPGDASNLFDPGKLSLTLEFADGSSSLKTSFDSVALGKEGRELIVGRFARAVRKASGDKLCGKSDFYDLETSQES